MKILSIIPDIGPGGLTGAVLNRMSLLAEAGNEAAVFLYQFMPNFDLEIDEQKQSGRLRPNVKIYNPYDYFDKLFSSRSGYRPENFNSPNQHVTHNSNEIIETYFDENLVMQAKVFRALGTRKLTKIQYFNQSSSLSKEEVYYSRSSPFIVRYFENGHLVNESFLSKNGYCYLKQEINPKTGRYSGFWSWGVDGEVKFYKSIWDWRRDFVRDVVCAKSTENILLCDGNNVPPQFLRMRNERFRVFAVIHMNHRGTNDKLRKHYAAYFDRLGEFDGVICLTEEQAQELRREFSVNDSLFVVPNRIASLDRSVVMAEQRIYDATVISRLETGKGVEDAVDAFKFVVDRLPSAQLSIFGSGSERERIEKAVIRNGLRDNVTLRGVTSAPMLEMSRSKVFMFTSESEGFGLTIAEAMSSGAPVVAFDCKYGPASLISNGMNGFLVQGRSNFELADNVVRLLDDDLMRSEFSHKSMEWFDNNLSDSAIMQRWNLAFNLK